MKIQIKEKKRADHVNPPLLVGQVYQELDMKGFYLAGITIQDNKQVILLFNLADGGVWRNNGGFGSGRFINVTSNSTFTVEV